MSTEPKTKKIVNIKLEPEWLRLAQGLSIVLGYDSFESYVSACIESDIRMYLMGGNDDIAERFRDSYKYLINDIYEPERLRRRSEISK